MPKGTNLDRVRRIEAARVTLIEAVERILRDPHVVDVDDLFSHVCGALGVDTATVKRWRETLRVRDGR